MECATKTDIKELKKMIHSLKEDFDDLKNNISDIDCILTDDDKKAICDYENDKKEGRLISHEQLKKELALNV